MSLLDIADLSVRIGAGTPVKDVSLSLERGQILALVGQSGSGKSLTALAVLDLLPPGARRSGSIRLAGEEISALDDRGMSRIRGRKIGMIFQEPSAALNPVMTIGLQVAETVRLHDNVPRREAARRADRMLAQVGLPADTIPRGSYPHQLSGGQCQRVAIAAALVAKPDLLIADEPTTALDATIQAEIIALLRMLVSDMGMGLLLITHDLPLVSTLADTIAVMHAGCVIDDGPARTILTGGTHRYTRALIEASWQESAPAPSRRWPTDAPILEAEGIVRTYRRRGQPPFHAVDGVDLTIERGERVALVGESGSGKSTLMRTLLGLEPLDAGSVRIGGELMSAARPSRSLRRQIQAVFQDPVGSLDPRWRVGRSVAEPMALLDRTLATAERQRVVGGAFEAVGLGVADMDRYPHQFSGGQRQRLAIARALIIEPSLLVLDEATSALDAALKIDILDLVRRLSDERGVACLLITHDLGSVRRIADRLLVMRAGRIIEAGPTDEVLHRPKESYTKRLIAAVPVLQAPAAQPSPAA